jgi:hypothetical protein
LGVSRAGSGDLARRDPEGGGLSPRVSAAVLAAAFAFFLLDCILLVASGPSLSTVHAFAAFIVIAIVAASNQLVPVLSGAPPAAPGAVILRASRSSSASPR